MSARCIGGPAGTRCGPQPPQEQANQSGQSGLVGNDAPGGPLGGWAPGPGSVVDLTKSPTAIAYNPGDAPGTPYGVISYRGGTYAVRGLNPEQRGLLKAFNGKAYISFMGVVTKEITDSMATIEARNIKLTVPLNI